MGDVWEPQTRYSILIPLSLLKAHNKSLTDESFHTLMAEVEGIMSSMPLTVETLSCNTSYKPLSPSDELMMNSKVVLPPAANFQKDDVYIRKY